MLGHTVLDFEHGAAGGATIIVACHIFPSFASHEITAVDKHGGEAFNLVYCTQMRAVCNGAR